MTPPTTEYWRFGECRSGVARETVVVDRVTKGATDVAGRLFPPNNTGGKDPYHRAFSM